MTSETKQHQEEEDRIRSDDESFLHSFASSANVSGVVASPAQGRNSSHAAHPPVFLAVPSPRENVNGATVPCEGICDGGEQYGQILARPVLTTPCGVVGGPPRRSSVRGALSHRGSSGAGGEQPSGRDQVRLVELAQQYRTAAKKVEEWRTRCLFLTVLTLLSITALISWGIYSVWFAPARIMVFDVTLLDTSSLCGSDAVFQNAWLPLQVGLVAVQQQAKKGIHLDYAYLHLNLVDGNSTEAFHVFEPAWVNDLDIFVLENGLGFYTFSLNFSYAELERLPRLCALVHSDCLQIKLQGLIAIHWSENVQMLDTVHLLRRPFDTCNGIPLSQR